MCTTAEYTSVVVQFIDQVIKMKMIFNKEEDMNNFIKRVLELKENLYTINENKRTYKDTCIGCIINPDTLGCYKYIFTPKSCVSCFENNYIELSYVKNCTECAKTSTCTQYYRNDLVSGFGTCSPIPK